MIKEVSTPESPFISFELEPYKTVYTTLPESSVAFNKTSIDLDVLLPILAVKFSGAFSSESLPEQSFPTT